MSGIFLVVLIFYGLILIAAGSLLSRTVRGAADFFVAGRNLGGGLLFATLLAANIGAGSTVGAAALGFYLGLSGWWWVGSAGIGSLILAFTVGPRIHRFASRLNLLTVGDFLEYRYGYAVRIIVAVVLWLGSLAILAGQLIAFARILEVVAGTSKVVGSFLGGVVVLIYFSASGLKGTAWINLIQLVVIGAGFLLALPIALTAAGGVEVLVRAGTSSGHPPGFYSPAGIGLQGILSYLVLLVPSFIVSPGLLQKIYGARSATAVKRGVAANGIALILFSFFPVTLGMIAADRFPDLAHGDLALPTVITEFLPIWLGALLLAAIFSAEISSADAVLFMLSTSVSRDLYQRHFQPGLDEKGLLSAGRWISVLAGAVAVALAGILPSVISALSIFYTLLSVALFVPLLFGLYRRRPRLTGTCPAAILAAVSAVIVTHFVTRGEGWGIFSPAALGILVSAAVFLSAWSAGSWRTRARAADRHLPKED